MASDTPAHDFLAPRLAALVDEAARNGIARDVAVAVLTDLVTGPAFNTAVPDPQADSAPLPGSEPGGADAESLVRAKTDLVEQAVAPSGYV